jgi:GMP synthase-like glutamine amidotransferase
MRPIAVIQNSRDDGPGEFEVFASNHGIPLSIYRLYARDPLPAGLAGLAGLCILGSPASVNDDREEFRAMERLIHEARRERVPVIGHCFGGQMLSKALGGEVGAAHVAEIGWSQITPRADAGAAQWFGSEPFLTFHWHFETFSIPRDAQLLATNPYCFHQAFIVDDLHLAMQFHCEIDETKIEAWLDRDGEKQIASTVSSAVQSAEVIRDQTPRVMASSKRTAAHIYARWAQGLKR